MAFLPISKKDMEERGWNECDIVLVTGDAYVDHPSFGTAVISRVLEDNGFRVCILSQPQNDADYHRFGIPRLAFYINGGNIDSMVAHYTAAKKPRSEDAYTAGGKAGKRPDRATIVYSQTVRRLFGDVPIAIGGLEASLRRFAHYDYWDDAVRPSILLDSKADILMFGMGEKSCVEIGARLRCGEKIKSINDVKGTMVAVKAAEYIPRPCAECPSYEIVRENTTSGKKQYAKACLMQQQEHDIGGKSVIQRHGSQIIVQNPPMPLLTQDELDAVYELPYERNYHPSYERLNGVPGIEEVKFSIIQNRGCFGACNFCSLAFHQGRTVCARSIESVVREAKIITQMPDFKGYIHDVGGPTANFRKPSCEKQLTKGMCRDRKCLAPQICPAIKPDHSEYLELLRELRKLPKVKKVFIRSGIRFDYLIADKDETFFRELVENHVSGQLKVAPEHCCDAVLDKMGKPHFEAYLKFKKRFYELTKAAGKEQFLVPYLISSHPGSTLKEAVELALFLKKERLRPEQVQDFYPTPGTISTAMFYTGLDPYTMDPVYVPTSTKEKAEQRALLQYFRKENASSVRAALRDANRPDLIGAGANCLVAAAPEHGSPNFKPYLRKTKSDNHRPHDKQKKKKHGV
ncbi:MAG: YgiQ family radical SAM protein [Oscillospiraceae bacterium]